MTVLPRALAATLIAGVLLLGETAARAESADALFAKYPATAIYRGKPAPPNLASHKDARMFRTRLREAVKEAKRANFAGHMIVATWGCGTSCQQIALVDARNGKVYFAPDPANLGVDFRLNSRLLVVNPPENIRETYKDQPPPDWAKTELYLWDKGRLTKLR